jgi:hypothetical protein
LRIIGSLGSFRQTLSVALLTAQPKHLQRERKRGERREEKRTGAQGEGDLHK